MNFVKPPYSQERIEQMAEVLDSNMGGGLCRCAAVVLLNLLKTGTKRRTEDIYTDMQRYLLKLGAPYQFGEYFWDLDDKGKEERMTMLAFMHTWAGEEA